MTITQQYNMWKLLTSLIALQILHVTKQVSLIRYKRHKINFANNKKIAKNHYVTSKMQFCSIPIKKANSFITHSFFFLFVKSFIQ